MILRTRASAIFAAILAASWPDTTAVAEPAQVGASKREYTLWHPTPRELMREMSADRPDKTDSPFTVDAGHFQLEMDLANSTRSQNDGMTFRSIQYAPMNLKVGLLNNVDLQLVIEPYTFERTEGPTPGVVDTVWGFSGVTPRMKINLWGNDEGRTALAVMPFVNVPTSQDQPGVHAVEGGVKFPFAIKVPNWDVSLMTECDIRRNQNTAGYHAELVNSVSVGHKLAGQFSLFAEFYSSVSTAQDSGWVGTIDTWLTYQINANLRLDGGVYIGVTPAADDLHPFVGLTWRY